MRAYEARPESSRCSPTCQNTTCTSRPKTFRPPRTRYAILKGNAPKSESQTWPIHNFSRASSRTESPGINHDRNASQGPVLTIMTHRVPASRRPSSLFSSVRARGVCFQTRTTPPRPNFDSCFSRPRFSGRRVFLSCPVSP